ncbi:MAG TPA: macro domain-containing protein [Verrucomicrobiae bacterium]|nr:macro domain-containing protein [Verrucomicrobiae bacterium]
MDVKIGTTKLSLISGDITAQDTDAVVNAANRELTGGSGVNGAIRAKGGPGIDEACRKIGGCAVGNAVITSGGNLPARYVIHAVGPIWQGGENHEPELLAGAYRRSLEIAVKNGLKSISFPAISTGVYGYPLRLAAPVALGSIIQFLKQEKHSLQEVRIVIYHADDVAYTVFKFALEDILSKDR